MPDMIYEAIDTTDDEGYHTIGLWRDLEEAITAIAGCSEPAEVCSENNDFDQNGFAEVEIRERAIGFCDLGRLAANIEWDGTHDEASDETSWTVKVERKPATLQEGENG